MTAFPALVEAGSARHPGLLSRQSPHGSMPDRV